LPRIGERIDARGNFDGNIFLADTVSLATTTNPDPVPAATDIDFVATVTAIQSAGRVTVRRDNGVIYTVNTRLDVPANVNIGDRVRITGETTGNNIANVDSIVLAQNNTPNRGPVNFEATVTDIPSTTQILARRDNGVTYTVTSTGLLPRNLAVGDRVQIAGELTGRNLVAVERVTRVRTGDTTTEPRPGAIVRLRGTVESSQGRMLQVRGDDNRLYTVRANNASVFPNGAIIRIIGTYENDVLVASSVTRVRE
jgi:hypothetical protein